MRRSFRLAASAMIAASVAVGTVPAFAEESPAIVEQGSSVASGEADVTASLSDATAASESDDATVETGADVANIATESLDASGQEAGTTQSKDDTGSAPAAPEEDAVPVASLYGMGHIQNVGWAKSYQLLSSDDSTTAGTIGTPGSGLRLEALKFYVEVNGQKYGLTAVAHVQNKGWMDPVTAAEDEVGTVGKSLRIEALRLSLPDELKDAYSIEYRVYVSGKGWLDWTKDGGSAGTQGYGLPIEAIQFRLVGAESADVPATGSNAFYPCVLQASSHVQNIGWMSSKSDMGSMSVTLGTTGKALRLEAFKLTVNGLGDGGVTYSAHVQNKGWMTAVSNGDVAGTYGQSLRVEAVKFELTGDLKTKYDIYYRVHVQNIGWMGWAKNGAVAGTTGASARLEAVEIKLVPKGGAAPGSTSIASIEKDVTVSGSEGYLTKGATAYAYANLGATAGTTGKSLALTGLSLSLSDSQGIGGGVTYKAHFSNVGWTSSASNGAALSANGNTLEAVQFSLTGGYAKYYNIYYRVHVSNYGWTGWAMNGASAGSTGCSRSIEAYEVVLVPKGGAAPGSTANTFSDEKGFLRKQYSSGNAELDNILKTIVNKHVGTGSDSLRNAFNYVASNFTYRTINGSPSGNWKVNYALEIYKTGSGNCYRFSSLFYQLANYLGYEARLVVGSVKTTTGNAPHCWVEIKMDGTWYAFDPDMKNAYRYKGLNWYKMTYDTSPIIYNESTATRVS